MFKRLLKKLKSLFKKDDLVNLVHLHVWKAETREIEKTFARLFSTDDGHKVLGHLNAITFMRSAGPEATNEALRHLDGQRGLLTTILRLIERGRVAG